jgi:lysophospholipase L1-like esterase
MKGLKRLSSVVGAVLLSLVLVVPVAAAPGSSDEHAKHYYLSLGDSLAAGVQPIGDPADLYRTSEGYAEQLLGIARASFSKLALVKLGCPGETTTTMLAGGICSYPHGSQLDEAVAFLEAHRQFVAFVTIDIAANDFACNDFSCVPAGVATVQANLPVILAALREAAGPDVPIVGMNLYNPFLAAWFGGPEGQQFAQATTFGAILPINDMLGAIYGAYGAPVADVESAFSTADFTTIVSLPGAGDVPINVARICAWTWVCAPAPLGPDNHANAAGYGVIALAFAAELGL